MPELHAVDPRSGATLASYPETTEEGVRAKLAHARTAQAAWAMRSLADRARALQALAHALRAGQATYAALMTREMGKPITASEAEIEKCARVCEHYAQTGAEQLADRPIGTEAQQSLVAFRPLGLVLAVMPWNFPFWQFFRCAAPALLAGNGVVLKHASNVPGSALAIEQVCGQVPALTGLVHALLIDNRRVPELIGDPAIAAVTLTGSTTAGEHVAGTAGRHLKKCVMELGGSDPYIVLEDADLDLAVEACVTARMINNGQSCIAGKRFIVVQELYEAFCDRMSGRMAGISMGDPALRETLLGPMARVDLRDALHAQVVASMAGGARLRAGGTLPEGPGAYYPATVLVDVVPGMPAFDEELFGPVAAIIRADDEEHALALANRSEFGLGGAIFSRDTARATRLARERLEVGCAFVNTHVRSDPRLPFGGVKRSGFGRELGPFGILEFVNVKTLYVA